MTKDVKALLSLLNRQQKNLETAMRIPKKIEKQIASTLENLRTEIMAGNSTGDKVTDFILVRYGLGEETKKIEKFYRAIDAKLHESVGQFVLLTHTFKVQFCFRDPGPSRDEDFIKATRRYLCVVKEGGLILPCKTDTDLWEIPAEQYLIVSGSECPKLKAGNMPPPNLYYYDLYTAITMGVGDENITLLIGDSEVSRAEFLYRPPFESPHFKRWASMLGRKI